MKKIKIAYLDYSPHFAGAERALCTIIKNLDRDIYEPIIVFPFPREHHSRYNHLGCKTINLFKNVKWWMGSDKWKHPLRGSDFLKRSILGLYLAILLKRHNIRILHVNLLRPDCKMWLYPSHLLGVQIIGHFRSLPLSWVPSKGVQKLCNHIICVSKIVQEHLLTKYKHPNSSVIYDTIDTDLIKITDHNIKKRPVLASVAALFPNKGHDNAIHAFNLIADKYPQFELHIVGGGNPSELFRLENIVKEYPHISNRILFTRQQVSNVSEIYSSSTLVLSLTKEGEAFGLVPFEAALCEAPTIAPNKGAIVELLEDNISGLLVETENIQDIASKIDWALSHPSECHHICMRTKAIVKEQLVPSVMVKNICDLYRLLSEKKLHP